MAKSLSELLQRFESLWPLAEAEEWDRPGLTVGSQKQSIDKVLLTIDVTKEVIEEAISLGCQLIVSHHPVLLKGASFLGEEQLKGELVSLAIRNSVALYSAHTNADIVEGGVSDILAQSIGIIDSKPLVEITTGIGHGRIGQLAKPVILSELANQIAGILPATSAPVRVAGQIDMLVSKVAVVGGAGDSFIKDAQAQGADCFVTSDLRHHVSLDAVSDPEKPLALIDISHFAAESLWLWPTVKKLSELEPSVDFLVSRQVTDPWTMTVLGKSAREG